MAEDTTTLPVELCVELVILYPVMMSLGLRGGVHGNTPSVGEVVYPLNEQQDLELTQMHEDKYVQRRTKYSIQMTESHVSQSYYLLVI